MIPPLLFCRKKTMNILRRLAIWVSQTTNVLTGGMPDEMLCSRLWRGKEAGDKSAAVLVRVFDSIFFWDKDHCKSSYEDEVKRLHFPAALKQD